MTLNALSLMCSTIVINIKQRGDCQQCPSLPKVVVLFFESVLGRLTCTTPFRRDTYANCDVKRLTTSKHNPAHQYAAYESSDVSWLSPADQDTSEQQKSACLLNSRANKTFKRGRLHRGVSDGRSRSAGLERDPRRDWYFVAEVLDKVLLAIFLMIMFTAAIVSLVVIPSIHSNSP